MPFHESHIYVYSVNKAGRVGITRQGRFGVIGSGSKLTDQINDTVTNWLGYAMNIPNGEIIRAQVIYESISRKFRAAKLPSVGEPFEILLSAPSRFWGGYGWSNDSTPFVQIGVTKQQIGTGIKNMTTGEECTLLSILEWAQLFPTDFAAQSAALA